MDDADIEQIKARHAAAVEWSSKTEERHAEALAKRVVDKTKEDDDAEAARILKAKDKP